MPSEEMWKSMVGLLKEMRDYIAKEDTEMKTVKLEDAPNTGDDQEEIVGGPNPNGKPGAGVIKELDSDAEDEETEDEDEKAPAEEEEEKDDSEEELKSILKSIDAKLAKSDEMVKSVVQSELQKALPGLMKKSIADFWRKQGFHPSHPDVAKIDVKKTLGTDQLSDIKKSDEKEGFTGFKSSDDVKKFVVDQSGKSFAELAREREALGHFNMFGGNQ